MHACLALALGLAFMVSLGLNVVSGEGLSLPLWQMAAYFLSGGIGTVVVLRVMTAREERAVRLAVREDAHRADR